MSKNAVWEYGTSVDGDAYAFDTLQAAEKDAKAWRRRLPEDKVLVLRRKVGPWETVGRA
jgi:hypothetical protein